ncbi:MAG: aldehyde dehydrogenase family protein [Parvibaculum sp.]
MAMTVADRSQSVPLDPGVLACLAKDKSSFIDGSFVAAGGGRSVRSLVNPADGRPLCTVHEASDGDLARAVETASQCFEKRHWRGLRPADRVRVLLRFADILEVHGEELAQLETLNQGKSINLARAVDIGASIEMVRYAAGLASLIEGSTMDLSMRHGPNERYMAYTLKEPVGVVVGIAPWNFPLMIGLWKVIPALAAGCSIILKPSELTPLTALRVAELALEAGLPPGALNVVLGSGATVGARLIANRQVRKITFTGSTETGKRIAAAASGNVTRLSLELGGKNPAIFFADVGVEQAVEGAAFGAFLNQGQVCAAASRLYVEEPIYGRFVEALCGSLQNMKVGEGMNPASEITPLVSSAHRQKVLAFVEGARMDGGRTALGGNAIDRDGFFMEPTVLLDVPEDSRAWQAEAFGPAVIVQSFRSESGVAADANATDFGLAASVWTGDLSRALRLVPQLQAGTVWVNQHVPLDPALPFGGYKQSGTGRDFGSGWLDNYLETKSVCIRYSAQSPS